MTQSDGYHFYIAYSGGDSFANGLAVLDPGTGRIRATAGSGPLRGVLARHDGTGTRLYLPLESDAISRTGQFAMVDTRTLEAETSTYRGTAVLSAVDPAATRLFLLQLRDGVIEVDTTTGASTFHEAPGKPFTTWMTQASDTGKRLYLGNVNNAGNRKHTPYVIALEGGVPVTPQAGEQSDEAGAAVVVAAPKENFTVRILLSPDGATLYAWVPGHTDPLVAIDTATMAVTARAEGPAPAATAITPDGTRLYALYADGRGLVLDPATLSEAGTFPGLPDAAPVLAAAPDGTLCIGYSNRICTVVPPDADTSSAPARLNGVPLAVAAAIATEVAPQPEPEYVGEYKRDGALRKEQDGNLFTAGAFCPQGTRIPGYDKVYEGHYILTDSDRDENGGVWRKVPYGGQSKYFYRIPQWGNLLVDGDQVTWK
ncbi:YncE family protein [Streptomyces sp. LS1784]|uniref:YncE family protein n=1 Tax=Streptomyces sp. LS1784 TaxID=2851533 RepID=UPI001CCA0410|nr:hypothetical protein [Streptomyces sp. LS1784]